MAKSQAMFYKAFVERGDSDPIEPSRISIQFTDYEKKKKGVKKTKAAARFDLAGKGRANEGWTAFLYILN